MPKVQIPSQTGVLERVSVRLLLPEERERLDQLLEQEDYLHSARLGGQSLRYVAELDGQWVALLSFSAPALQIKAREKWLGWTPRQRARRRLHQRLWTGEPRLLCRARPAQRTLPAGTGERGGEPLAPWKAAGPAGRI